MEYLNNIRMPDEATAIFPVEDVLDFSEDTSPIDRVAMRAEGPLTEMLQWGSASRRDPSYKLWP